MSVDSPRDTKKEVVSFQKVQPLSIDQNRRKAYLKGLKTLRACATSGEAKNETEFVSRNKLLGRG
jgi:hypothetical protein